MKKTVCVTGATGFIGKTVCNLLSCRGYRLVKVSRNKLSGYLSIGDIDEQSDWSNVLDGVDCVIHLASKAHVFDKGLSETKETFFQVNVVGTVNLARQAANSGVRRFIFISSIGVNGSSSTVPFLYSDKPSPYDAYTQSKYKAEKKLLEIAKKTGLEVVIIRPPLVYGKNAPGNFGSLIKLVNLNIPLPFGAIYNRRSFIGVDNLADFISVCMEHPLAVDKVFLVSDDHDVSTTELIDCLIKSSGNNQCLIAVNIFLLRFVASLIGKASSIDKMVCDLQVDIDYTKKTLKWNPALSFQEGVQRCFLDD